MQQILMVAGNPKFMIYKFCDELLDQRFHGAFNTPPGIDWPESTSEVLKMEPGFGSAPDQPTALGDVHCYVSNARIFSERVADAIDLDQRGILYPVQIEGRESERFFWFRSTDVIDCLDHENTTWINPHLMRKPAFLEDKLADAKIFTVPEDQRFQNYLFMTEDVLSKLKSTKPKLKGFAIRRDDLFFGKPVWQS